MAVWGSVASCCAASTSSTRRAPSPSPATTSPRPGPSPFTWFRECRSKRWREESSAWPSSCSRWFRLTLTSWRWPTPPAGSSSSWSSSCRPNSHDRAKFPTLIFLIHPFCYIMFNLKSKETYITNFYLLSDSVHHPHLICYIMLNPLLFNELYIYLINYYSHQRLYIDELEMVG